MSELQSSPKKREKPLHVAVVAWQGLPAIYPEMGRNIGGLETAAWLLARELARRDSVNCSFFVRAGKPMASDPVEGVNLVADIDPREPIRREVSDALAAGPSGAFRRFRPSLLWQIPYLTATWPWRRHDPAPRQPDPRLISHRPDVWVAMGASRESAGVVATANSQDRPSVLMVQSNSDLDPRYATDPTFQSRYGERAEDCLFAIRHADQVVCQTNHQLGLLRESFDREGVLLRNAIDLDRWVQAPVDAGDHVLWIGRYDDFHKRPHLALEIAARCPEIPFRMIINPSDVEVQRRLADRCPSNVTIDEYVPSDAMPQTMAGCRLFLSTGAAEYEGFPNVLLQATAVGKPIVSLDDFDGYLASSGAGVHCAGDVDAAVTAIGELFSGLRVVDHERARRYLDENHSVGMIVSRLFELLTGLCGDR